MLYYTQSLTCYYRVVRFSSSFFFLESLTRAKALYLIAMLDKVSIGDWIAICSPLFCAGIP